MPNVFYICSWLTKTGIEEDRPISNISLQKLLYFGQGLHLAESDGNKLFENKIYAWDWGPVVKDVYHEFKAFGNNSITRQNLAPNLGLDFLNKAHNLTLENQIFLKSLWDIFKDYSPFELVELTHAKGSPWYEIFLENNKGKIPRDVEITTDKMLEYFKKFVA